MAVALLFFFLGGSSVYWQKSEIKHLVWFFSSYRISRYAI